jgi:hypothetical protein
MPPQILSLQYHFKMNTIRPFCLRCLQSGLLAAGVTRRGCYGAPVGQARCSRRACLKGGSITRLRRGFALAPDTVSPHIRVMFTVCESEAEAIRHAYEAGGETSAVVELRRHFPIIADNENTRLCVRTIASWTPLPPRPRGRRGCPIKS